MLVKSQFCSTGQTRKLDRIMRAEEKRKKWNRKLNGMIMRVRLEGKPKNGRTWVQGMASCIDKRKNTRVITLRWTRMFWKMQCIIIGGQRLASCSFAVEQGGQESERRFVLLGALLHAADNVDWSRMCNLLLLLWFVKENFLKGIRIIALKKKTEVR